MDSEQVIEEMLQSTRKCSAFIELNKNCLVELEELMQCHSEPNHLTQEPQQLLLEAQ